MDLQNLPVPQVSPEAIDAALCRARAERSRALYAFFSQLWRDRADDQTTPPAKAVPAR